MKLNPLKTTVFLALSLIFNQSFSQDWDLNGNAILPFNFFGTTNNQQIRIQTNNINRQILANGGIGINAGQIAMGNNLPNNFNPQSRLHLHQTGGITTTRFTNFA